MNPVTIQYINNDGGGFSGPETVPAGTTIRAFFNSKVGGDPSRYQISVNRENVDPNYVVKSDDRVSFTPAKVAGA